MVGCFYKYYKNSTRNTSDFMGSHAEGKSNRKMIANPLPNTMHAGFSGNVTFSGLRPGLYVLKIHAYNRRDDARTVKRGFVVTSDPNYCSLVLVNDVRVSESGREAVVEVKGHGPAEGFSCVLDSGEQFSCKFNAHSL